MKIESNWTHSRQTRPKTLSRQFAASYLIFNAIVQRHNEDGTMYNQTNELLEHTEQGCCRKYGG